MRPLLLALCLFCIAPTSKADILHYDVSGLTLYARIQTGETTFVAVALTPGTSGAIGQYVLTDANILAAGVSTKNLSPGYKFTIRVGTPSTTANDAIYGSGVLYWTGSAEAPPGINLMQMNGYPTVDGKSWAQLIAIIAANAGGNITGSETDAPNIKSLDNDLNRMSATVDADGDRTVTYNLTDIP